MEVRDRMCGSDRIKSEIATGELYVLFTKAGKKKLSEKARSKTNKGVVCKSYLSLNKDVDNRFRHKQSHCHPG